MTIRQRKQKKIEFIAWDGEGANDKYILLRNSHGSYISSIEGLSTSQCLQFLTTGIDKVDRDTRYINVIFGGSYDVNMLLCDLSRTDIYKLWHYGHVTWRGYNIRYIHRKSFTASYRTTNNMDTITKRSSSDRKSLKHSWQSITLWDVFGFFQSTFIDALQQYLPDFNQELLANIIAHKKDRSQFKPEQFDEINEYCKQEIDALVNIMEKLKDAMETAQLTVSRWDGAGAIAQALLRKYRVKEHQRDFSNGTVLEKLVHTAAWKAYAGGRIECLQYGHHSNSVFHADINSAYPTATLQLPSFSDGEWKHTNSFSPRSYGLYHVRFDFYTYRDKPFFPFFYRDVQGSICYPICGQGYYWQPEVEAALKWMSNGVEIQEGWIWLNQNETINAGEQEQDYQQCVESVLPFSFVQDVYKQRLEYKKTKNAAQKVLKLGMNSLYGKLAQQIGYKKNEKPAFQQIEWAGYITSTTRAKLFDIGMQHPQSVIMFATDGIFSTTSHDVDVGTQLGQWEVHTHDEMIVAQSGVYWYRDSDEWTDKFRGFDREDLSWQKVLDSFRQSQWHLTVRSTRFLTMGGALQSSALWTKWRTWPKTERTLCLLACGTSKGGGTKRIDITPWWCTMDNPSLRLFQTKALINEYAMLGIESQPYKKTRTMIVSKRLDKEQQDGFI